MAKKHKKTELKRLPTKRQLSRHQQQQKIQRTILIAGSIFFAFIIALGSYGIYSYVFKNLRQPVLKVNDTVIKMDYYVDALSLFLQDVDAEQVSLMTDVTYTTILQNELIIQNAPGVGISVEQSEIDARLKELNQPDKKIYRDMHEANILAERLIENYINPTIPTEAEQVKVEALFVETLEKAEEMGNKINEGDSFSSLAEIFSVEPVTKENKGDLGWLPKGLIGEIYESLADSKLGEIVFDLEPGVLSEPTYDPTITKEGGYWIIEVLEKDGDKSANVRGILVGSLDEAIEVKNKLEDGEDFASLVSDMSQHQESREYEGDLGWIQKGFGNETINKSAFELEIGTISEPLYDDTVSTKGGYWLIKVLEKEDQRPVDEEIVDKMSADAFAEWITEQRDKSDIEELIDSEQEAWAVERALKNIRGT